MRQCKKCGTKLLILKTLQSGKSIEAGALKVLLGNTGVYPSIECGGLPCRIGKASGKLGMLAQGKNTLIQNGLLQQLLQAVLCCRHRQMRHAQIWDYASVSLAAYCQVESSLYMHLIKITHY